MAYEFDARKVGERIHELRCDLDLSVTDLSEICGVPRTTLHAMECEDWHTSVESYAKVALGLGVSVSSLIGEGLPEPLSRRRKSVRLDRLTRGCRLSRDDAEGQPPRAEGWTRPVIDRKKTGERLETARHTKGLSRADVYERCGISRPYLHELECGRKLGSAATLLALASVYGCTVDDLLGWSE